jgi:hypothetical protein
MMQQRQNFRLAAKMPELAGKGSFAVHTHLPVHFRCPNSRTSCLHHCFASPDIARDRYGNIGVLDTSGRYVWFAKKTDWQGVE